MAPFLRPSLRSALFPPAAVLVPVAAALVVITGCSKKPAPTAAPPPPPAAAASAPVAAPAAPPAVAPPAAATAAAAEVAPQAADPRKNGWDLPARGTAAKEGDRVYVLTQGKDRSYANAGAVYHLFAQDLGEIRDDVMTVKELGGGSFPVTGLFVIPAGTEKASDLKMGDMVLAEWASSLKHAIVTKVEGDKVTVRYTDLPDTWTDDKTTAVKAPREVTRQKEGLQGGNFAIAVEDGRPIQVLLVADSGDKWLARRFANRVAAFPTTTLTPIPLKPTLKAGQAVWAPWVGMMYKGKVKKVGGTRVEVAIEAIASKEPVVTSLGQVLPDDGKPLAGLEAAK